MPEITFTEGADNYTISGTGNYYLHFLGGNDILTVNGGDYSTADMGAGNDRVRTITGQANVDGGAGSDRYDVWADDLTGNAGADDDFVYIRGGQNIFLFGGEGNDRFTMYVPVTYLVLSGDDGDDTFLGRGHMFPDGIFTGGAGNDRFFDINGIGDERPEIAGGPGNDLYRIDPATAPIIRENPDEGIDTVQIPLGTIYALPANIENLRVLALPGSTTGTGFLIGNASNNILTASINDDELSGGGGNDWLYGRGGNDLLNGGEGKDNLYGHEGNDELFGGELRDVLNGGTGADTMYGGTGDDVYYVDNAGDIVWEYADEGTDLVWSSLASYTLPDNVESGAVHGSTGRTLAGNALANTLTGGAGDDTLTGGGGNDNIRGGAGDDTINGNAGMDLITGGAGADTMSGGAAADVDTFVFTALSDSTPGAMDQILNFETDVRDDIIDLSAIDANTALAGNQDFTLAGGAQANSVWVVSSGVPDQYYIYGDVNGDTTPDFALLLNVIGAKPVLANFDGVMAGN